MHRLDDITLTIEGARADQWVVAEARVVERLFGPTRMQVLASSSEAVDADSLMGRPASLEVALDGVDPRAFHGVVLEVEESAARRDRFDLRVVIGSRLALLRLGRDHRIFQEMTVPDVVRDVLDRAAVASVGWGINASYEPHVNVVQYGESDYDFVARLLAEEGIGFLVEQDEVSERVLFFDDDTAFLPIDGDSLVPFVGSAGVGRHGLHTLGVGRVAGSDEIEQRDYDPRRPAESLSTTAEAPDGTARAVYRHPGMYVEEPRGQRLTDRWLERLQVETHAVRGVGEVHTFAPGRFFTAAEAPRADLDGDYLIVEVEHRFGGEERVRSAYDNSFRAIPFDVPYRPAEAPPAPHWGGVQHAFVTVPGGEEIHVDDLGRCKVRFVWDRSGITDDKSSTWMRVGQLSLGGSMIHPRGDFEVLVDVELADLDRPAISGHLYHAEAPPPYALPGGATVTSLQTATTAGGPGANELRFEDTDGGLEIFVNASKDMNGLVDNDAQWSVGANETSGVGSNHTLSVTGNHAAKVVGSRSLDVGANQDSNVAGNYDDRTGVDLGLSIGANRMVQVGGNHNERNGGNLDRTVGSLQCLTGLKGVTRSITGDASIDVGAAWAEMSGGARGLSVTASLTETVAAVKLIQAKNVSIACDAAYVMTAAAEIVKAAGRNDTADGAVALTAGAAFNVKAKNIVFEAQDKLVFRGGGAVIELSSSGSVKIKAPTVTVLNSKALNQLMHKSN